MNRPDRETVTDPGSFRDPAGRVRLFGGRVFRTLSESAWADFQRLQSTGVLDALVSGGKIVATRAVAARDLPPDVIANLIDDGSWSADRVLEHDAIPYLSYPYEWPFTLLKRAALHHLDLHLELLNAGFSLSDATAYNIQFRGTTPVFIDVPSIRPYQEGEYWAGYRQFCEQFLNPLLLGSWCGVPHQAWYRGNVEGIPIEDLAHVLPLRARFSWQAWMHVVLHARMVSRTRSHALALDKAGTQSKRKPMSKAGLAWMLKGLRRWIAGLAQRGSGAGTWTDYATRNSYRPEEAAAKKAFVAEYCRSRQPKDVIDLGCNVGDYSEAALTAGVSRVIGFDVDHGALEIAVAKADAGPLNFLPLYFDAMNPSSDLGWAQRERRGFVSRAKTDGLLALAFLHHLIIGRNVPMSQALEWLTSLAPSGVVEFVPKQDPMVQAMLAHRDDIFPAYDVEAFRRELTRHARIEREQVVSASGRTLFEFQR